MYPTRIFYQPADKAKPVLELADENYHITAESLEGWGATLEDIVEETAVIPGNIVLGQKVLSTNINFQVLLTASAGIDFDLLYRRLRSSFSRIAAGTLSVVTPGVGMRSIKCRLAEPITPPRVDPRSATHALVDVHLIADEGLWYQNVTDTFINAQSSSDNTMTSSVTITNTGFLTSYPVITIIDPTTWTRKQDIISISMQVREEKAVYLTFLTPWMTLFTLPESFFRYGSTSGLRWNPSPLDFANPSIWNFKYDRPIKANIKTEFLQRATMLRPLPILPNQSFTFKLDVKTTSILLNSIFNVSQGFVSVPSYYLDPWSDK